ncbi:PAS domain S-box-containing protein/diguanylate cyclase (GGDEF) domain-containing protein [Peptoclostridium litorale DSM 5388]|uniref:Diguanylate cyclase and metal dependent phosphohydrolase n=1 Tax=Peptoclostridium litorale DSM 5388 TaxID=1121324 RepID=A0A069RH61_PEPLI|nr:HD domain-containing phosphohydrolase [Peptoclostridium litorale]KDR95510.1 diguanylate cyclase and metal dependent phosphohydrolase [Peptoclostridium litorale DSM 5388]SIO17159.1 PAS domain S-box-containing protein/diguanylate cyclase (GGDEF) domain-containing protein [Peptoclostridium litorale DSM 5388]
MEKNFVRDVLQQAPFGYAYHKVILDHEGKPKDYVFLDVNPAFEKMTGLKGDEIIGKGVVDVIPGIRDGGFDWVAFYGMVAMDGKGRDITQYLEALDRWYKVSAFSLEKGYFTVVFQEVTEEMQRIEKLESQKKQIEKLAEEKENLLKIRQAMFREHAAIMLIIEPSTGKIIEANPSACSFYGYEREELINMKIQDINMLSDEEVKMRRTMALEKKQKYFIFTHRLKSGETRIVEVYSCPITYNGAKVLYSIIFDVTRREKYKKRLYEEKELLKTTLFSIGDGVITTDEHGSIKLINKTAQQITGYDEKEVKGRCFSDVFKFADEISGDEIEDPVTEALKGTKEAKIEGTAVIRVKAGALKPISKSIATIKAEDGQLMGAVMAFRDVSKEKEQQEKIIYLSYHDSLTGIYNRRFMEENIKRLDTACQLPLSIIMGDLNGLKLTNDVFGHDAGDRLLIEAVDVIKKSCRCEDIIARWGGDEFLILLPQTNSETAEGIVQNIRRVCSEKGDGNQKLSIALGTDTKTDAIEDFKQVMRKAEELMYQTKLIEGKGYRENIIEALMATLFEKSCEMDEHGDRLQNTCICIGRSLNLTSKALGELRLLAKLHDIGKVAIDENILNKPGPLTNREWGEIKKHPEVGFRIAQNISEISPVAEYILCHHERWDGRGYPRGLKGEEIPLLSRILSVVDAFDAMTNDRAYREKMETKEALAEIKRNSGTQFDPEIVEKFMNANCMNE